MPSPASTRVARPLSPLSHQLRVLLFQIRDNNKNVMRYMKEQALERDEERKCHYSPEAEIRFRVLHGTGGGADVRRSFDATVADISLSSSVLVESDSKKFGKDRMLCTITLSSSEVAEFATVGVSSGATDGGNVSASAATGTGARRCVRSSSPVSTASSTSPSCATGSFCGFFGAGLRAVFSFASRKCLEDSECTSSPLSYEDEDSSSLSSTTSHSVENHASN